MSQKVSYMSHFAYKTAPSIYLSMSNLYILDKCANFAAQYLEKEGVGKGVVVDARRR